MQCGYPHLETTHSGYDVHNEYTHYGYIIVGMPIMGMFMMIIPFIGTPIVDASRIGISIKGTPIMGMPK